VDLVLPFRRGLVGGTVLTHAEPGEDGYALLFLAPPPSGSEVEVPRDLTFVVDISGSMSGGKMEQARTALRQALADLRPADRFRLIAFSSGVREFREGWSPVTPAALSAARQFIDRLSANGGTNIAGALDAALRSTSSASRMSLIFFVTDGLPSVGEQQPDRIAANAAGQLGRHRVFTFGVGQDVNTYLLDRLAVEGRGSASYVAPEADVSDAVGGVLSKLSRPALVDLRIVSAPVRFLDQAPAVLPDLFYGEELVVLSRYRGTGSGPVIIEGSRNGRRERFEVRGAFQRHEDDNRYVPQLWASRRIGELTRQLRIEGSTPELIAQIRDLGLKHGILTEYTSYLVQEPGMLAARNERTQPQLAAAPPAAEQTGRIAFDAAKSSATMAGASTIAESERAVRQRSVQLSERRDGQGAGVELRRAGGRMFTLRDGVLTDVTHDDSLRVTTIAPFSRAYFELVAARPALREALAVGTPVVIAGRRASLKVAEGGTATWAAGAMTRFLQEFDGR
jgi:Ca-activated chloride channel family protein